MKLAITLILAPFILIGLVCGFIAFGLGAGYDGAQKAISKRFLKLT